ncbi:MAG: hypothetical protein IJH50_06850 [Kiritimatiellae bacterium]|nr:hypothetical protein [Kiritimatiellia bacterium]
MTARQERELNKGKAREILAKMNDMIRGKDYAKMVMDGKVDQMCMEIRKLGWMVLTKSLKMKEIDGKREMRVQLKLVDPDSAEARDLP